MKTRCDKTQASTALRGCREAGGHGSRLRGAFARGTGCFTEMSHEAPEAYADLGKNRLDTAKPRSRVDLMRQPAA